MSTLLVVGLLLFIALGPSNERKRVNKKKLIEERIRIANNILYVKENK